MADINKREDIEDFLITLEDMTNSKFILGERKIALSLANLASNPKLVTFFSKTMEHFNFNNELSLSKNKDVYGANCIILPKRKVTSVAFVFSLLYEIDSGHINLKEFLHTYFYDENPNVEWALFCDKIITPFKYNTEFLYVNGLDAKEDNSDANLSLKEPIISILQDINVKTSEQTNIAIDLKQEIFALTNAIENSLTPNKIELVKPLYFGLKNSVALTLNDKLSTLIKKLFNYLVSSEIF